MLILAVDLAAKYSAACVMDEQRRVVDQFDTWGLSEDRLVHDIHSRYVDHEPDTVIIEDLPHGLGYCTLIKTVCRLQGRIIERLAHTCGCNNPGCDSNGRSDILFVAPATWRAHYTGLERGTGPSAVVPVATRFGYTPPDLSLRAMREKGGKATARKVVTDYCSAYLIARWAHDTYASAATVDVVGTSRWNTPVIRKKDFDAENR